jgi:diaminohydroxyphosphoribosylaminopyrimidine deaminase/5-amino-6-(5-phosphoribosylamino)uracil reductase
MRVSVGCLRREAVQLNETYCHWMRTGRPYVFLKAAMTLDGKIATASGESRWITGVEARRDVHRMRSQVDAIMVGVGTILKDDPRLTARPAGRARGLIAPRQPLRVVLDSRLRIPERARVLPLEKGTGYPAATLIATTAKASKRRIEHLRARGVSVVVLPARDGRVSLSACLNHLGELGVSSVMIEGGSLLNASALRERLVNRIRLYVAPSLLGGQESKGVIGGHSPRRLAEAVPLTDMQTKRIGRDIVIEGRIATNPQVIRTK